MDEIALPIAIWHISHELIHLIIYKTYNFDGTPTNKSNVNAGVKRMEMFRVKRNYNSFSPIGSMPGLVHYSDANSEHLFKAEKADSIKVLEPGFAWKNLVIGCLPFLVRIIPEKLQTICGVAVDFFSVGREEVFEPKQKWFDEFTKGCQADVFDLTNNPESMNQCQASRVLKSVAFGILKINFLILEDFKKLVKL